MRAVGAALLSAALLLAPAAALGQMQAPTAASTDPLTPSDCFRPGQYAYDRACAREQILAWARLLGEPDQGDRDVGEGSARLIGDFDMGPRFALSLLLPRTVRTADPPEGPAFLSVRLFPQISRSMQSWNGQVEPGVARAVMADLDERMATLPRRPEEALGCLHSLTGAVWRARGVERTLQDVDFCQADGQALWPVYQRLFDQILETEGCESRWRDPRGQVREVMRCLRLRGDRRQAFAVLKASEALTAPLEGDEETPRRIFVDRDVFADEGMAVVSGRWSVALDVGESDERPFIESWSLQRNGIWRLEQRRGSAPGEGVARR